MRLVQEPECAEGVDHKDWSQEYQMHLCDTPSQGASRAAGPLGSAPWVGPWVGGERAAMPRYLARVPFPPRKGPASRRARGLLASLCPGPLGPKPPGKISRPTAQARWHERKSVGIKMAEGAGPGREGLGLPGLAAKAPEKVKPLIILPRFFQ